MDSQTATLTPVEFLRRFVQHVLPDGLHKIRHYGLYAGSHVQGALGTARAMLATPAPSPVQAAEVELSSPVATASWADLLRAVTGRDAERCPRCGGRLEHLPVVASARAPSPESKWHEPYLQLALPDATLGWAPVYPASAPSSSSALATSGCPNRDCPSLPLSKMRRQSGQPQAALTVPLVSRNDPDVTRIHL